MGAATPSALGLRDGIFDTTLAPIWYFYNIITNFSVKPIERKVAHALHNIIS